MQAADVNARVTATKLFAFILNYLHILSNEFWVQGH